jgi:hypothetical protein
MMHDAVPQRQESGTDDCPNRYWLLLATRSPGDKLQHDR